MKKHIPCLFLAVAAVGCHPKASGPIPVRQVRLGTAMFNLQVPRNHEEEDKGLMGVTKIPDDGGMLFDLRDRDVASMWMKNCPVPEDMVFVGAGGVIQKILFAAAEPTVKPDASYPNYTAVGVFDDNAKVMAAYKAHQLPHTEWVIELRAGRAAEVGLKEGQVLASQNWGRP